MRSTPQQVLPRLQQILMPAPVPRCQACFRPVGEQNPVRRTGGAVTVGCQTCTGDRRS